ncbi:hypothetical protein OSB04_018315 [Centaurea solstitialis]|uniref:Pectinesterase inhibitor domain-containing protein n=1 Tax=Centaurea solstitialis TaxID=347529 RepID=A0AA38WJ77_9ASTR|nr:hypothetical protein OSB04_018315 [Centaurea solstitialis]
MELQLSTILFFFFFLYTTAVTTTGGYFLPPASNDTDYIRTNCNTTRYPQTCFKSLSGYAASVHRDPVRLARVAIHVSLEKATHMATYVNGISHRKKPLNASESAAIKDCSSVFGDAVDEIRRSHKEMKCLGCTGVSLRFQLSNVQTWMSAALTNEDTCTDGLEEVPVGSGLKADVCGRVVTVKEVTSNALALVNRYAETIST